MKIVFMGTPDFAEKSLEALIDSDNEVVGVFSQPDKKVGRKQILTPPPVKQIALKYNIPIFQPQTLKNGEADKIIEKLKPDLIVVVAYGKILPKSILDAAKYGCINVHASLLPKYRGAAPIQWAVLNGDAETGVTVMQMDEGLDTGDMLLVKKTPIDINETSAELFERLALIGADALIETVDNIKNNRVEKIPQPKGDFGYASMISRDMSNINWNDSALKIHNQVRGLQTWPCASTLLFGKTVKIHKTELTELKSNDVGKIINNNGVLTVCCGDGICLNITEIQPEGKKRMNVKSFLAGNKIPIGTVLGE